MASSPLRAYVAGLVGVVALAVIAPEVSGQRGSMRRMGPVHPTFRVVTHVPQTMTRVRTTSAFVSTHFTRQIDRRRRESFRLTHMDRRELNRLRRLEPFLLPLVNPFANMNPYTQSPTSPYSGYFDGGADALNTVPALTVPQSQPQLAGDPSAPGPQAPPDEPRSPRTRKDNAREPARTPTAEQLRQDSVALHLDRARNGSPFTEIASGQALNRLLESLVRQTEPGTARPNVSLDADLLPRINVTASGNGAHLGLLKGRGVLRWPAGFRSLQPEEKGAELREHIEALLPAAIDRAGRGRTDGALLHSLSRDVGSLGELLRQNVTGLESGPYLEGRRFLGDLEAALAVLGRPDAARYVNGTYTARGETVAELVRHMADHGLRFAPALPGEEAAYVALHRALATYHDRVRPEASAAR